MRRRFWFGATGVVIAAVLVTGASAVSGVDTIRTIAGRGNIDGRGPNAGGGFSGDGGPATKADISTPSGLVVDPRGNVYIADRSNERVRKVSPNGTITTVVGNGRQDFSGDGGPATSAAVDRPEGIALDAQGNLYIADTGNARVRKVTPAGTISTFACTGHRRNGTNGSSGDGAAATRAECGPTHLAVSKQGEVYIIDAAAAGCTVRKIDGTGIITTIAGTGVRGFSGDGGPAIKAQMNNVLGIAVDAQGNIYLADDGNRRIRKITRDGKIRTIAGNGKPRGPLGDGGPATRAQISNIWDVAVDARGNVYIADASNDRVRKVKPGGKISTVAGNTTGPISRGAFGGDGGPARLAALSAPDTLALDSQGSLYVGELGNSRVRKITNLVPIASFTSRPSSGRLPVTVSFDGSGSRDRDGSIWKYSWDFGDGKSGTGRKIRHTFTRAGNFTVKLTVIDDSGGKATKTVTVTVSG
jgi:sugar lactone lactonase YvrE